MSQNCQYSCKSLRSYIRSKEVLTVRVDEEGVHLQTRRQAIKAAQAVVRKLANGRTGQVAEFPRERREEAARK